MSEIILSFKNFDKNFCSLKWAKRLKDIGVRQDTTFHYVWDSKNDCFEICCSESYADENYSAFTVQDFVDLFPKLFRIDRNYKSWNFNCEYAEMHLDNEYKLADVFARILITITKDREKKCLKLSGKKS